MDQGNPQKEVKMKRVLSVAGKRYRVLKDSDGYLEPGEIVIALESDISLPYCVLESQFIPGRYDETKYARTFVMDMEDELEPIDEPKYKTIRVKVSTNRIGSEVAREFQVLADSTCDEISSEAWECAMDLINFTWEEVK